MANALLTITDITREAVAVLHEQLQLAKHAVRKYEDRFGKNGSKGQIGTSVAIRKPPLCHDVEGPTHSHMTV